MADPHEEIRLIEGVARGDQQAFLALYDRYAGRQSNCRPNGFLR